MGGGAGSHGTTVFCLKSGQELFLRPFSAAYFDQAADDGAYHVAEESVRGDVKHPMVATRFPAGFTYIAEGCFIVRAVFTERSEILLF